MMRSILARIRGFISPSESEEPHAGGEEPLPEGYKEAAISIGEVDSPAVFDAPVPDIACRRCGEPFGSYWDWFNHLDEEHPGLEGIEEAQDWATVTVPTGHDGGVETSIDVDEEAILDELMEEER